MLSREAFHEQLRQFMHYKPFLPFVVELTEGRDIRVEEPTIAFGTDLAGYLSAVGDLHEFRREEVVAFRFEKSECSR